MRREPVLVVGNPLDNTQQRGQVAGGSDDFEIGATDFQQATVRLNHAGDMNVFSGAARQITRGRGAKERPSWSLDS